MCWKMRRTASPSIRVCFADPSCFDAVFTSIFNCFAALTIVCSPTCLGLHPLDLELSAVSSTCLSTCTTHSHCSPTACRARPQHARCWQVWRVPLEAIWLLTGRQSRSARCMLSATVCQIFSTTGRRSKPLMARALWAV